MTCASALTVIISGRQRTAAATANLARDMSDALPDRILQVKVAVAVSLMHGFESFVRCSVMIGIIVVVVSFLKKTFAEYINTSFGPAGPSKVIARQKIRVEFHVPRRIVPFRPVKETRKKLKNVPTLVGRDPGQRSAAELVLQFLFNKTQSEKNGSPRTLDHRAGQRQRVPLSLVIEKPVSRPNRENPIDLPDLRDHGAVQCLVPTGSHVAQLGHFEACVKCAVFRQTGLGECELREDAT